MLKSEFKEYLKNYSKNIATEINAGIIKDIGIKEDDLAFENKEGL